MYRGWHVCSQRTTCTCDSGRLRTSCSKGLYPLYWSHSNCPLGFNSPKCSVIHFYKHYVSLCVCCAKCGTWFLANYLNITYFAYQYTSVEVHPFVDIPQWKYIHLLMWRFGPLVSHIFIVAIQCFWHQIQKGVSTRRCVCSTFIAIYLHNDI